MRDKAFNQWSWALVILAALVVALWWSPCHAQTTSAPAFSLQRLSVGLGGDYVRYEPTFVSKDFSKNWEFRAALPISYNLGKYASLTGKITYGFDSRQKEYSAGFVLHLLARGKTP